MLAPYQKADVSFRYIKEIGQEGQNSKVYLSHDQYLDHELVIKEVVKSSINPDEYFREARLLYFSTHPNVVQVNYAAQDADNVYISMPFYANGSLSARMEKENLTAREIIRYSIHFLSGLHHIHTKRLMHFDIKPNNIMLSDRDEALLADFGLAEKVEASGFACPENFYNLHVAPEYFYQGEYSFSYDIYQAGLTIYRMAIGSYLFEMEVQELFTRGNIEEDIKTGVFPRRKYLPHIPKPLHAIIGKCLAVNPVDRYQSVQHILNDLSKIDDVCLDWRYSSRDDGHLWIKPVDGANLELCLDGASGDCHGKRVYPDGRTRKVGNLCVARVTQAKLYKLLKEN